MIKYTIQIGRVYCQLNKQTQQTRVCETSSLLFVLGGESLLRDSVPSAEGVQAEHPGAALAGGGGRGSDGHVGRRRGLRARRARLEPRARLRQLRTHCLLNH